MGRVAGGVALLLLSLFMLLDFVRPGTALSAPATIAAVLITVGLPAARGIFLMRPPLTRGKVYGSRLVVVPTTVVQITAGMFS